MRWRRFLAAASVLTLLPGVLIAQDPAKPPALDTGAIFDRLDQNGDGTVTKDEVAEDRRAFFDRVLRLGDKNADGKLTKEEFVAGLRGGATPRPDAGGGGDRRPGPPRDFNPEAFFRRLDKNGDGKLAKDEVPEQARRIVERADRNRDGEVTREEFAAAVRALRPTTDRPTAVGPDAAIVRALDANRDGDISAEELSRAPAALRALDRNGDGKISRPELGGGRPPGQPPQPGKGPSLAQRIRQLDKNGDGKISREEAPESLRRNFDRLDANDDGQLGETELRPVFDRLGNDRAPK